MSEIRIAEIVMAGRLAAAPSRLQDGTLHFLLEASEGEKPFHCFCEGETAENLQKFCEKGDEISLEGTLAHYQFGNEPKPRMLIRVRFISYGRKRRTLR